MYDPEVVKPIEKDPNEVLLSDKEVGEEEQELPEKEHNADE